MIDYMMFISYKCIEIFFLIETSIIAVTPTVGCR